jgi:DNA-binding transcriptional ArsR family regulator
MKSKSKRMTPEALLQVAARFKVLAEPIRLRILHGLQDGEMTISRITEVVKSTQPNVSKHLKMLQEAGLIARRQQGNTVYCSIADETVFGLCDAVCSSLQVRLGVQAGAFGRTITPVKRRT